MVASVAFLNELVDRFAKATAANRQTSGRVGSVIELTPADADCVVVTGDLHGNRENFHRIVRAVALDKHPKRHLVLQEVVHGGPAYPNGGCMSHMLLEDVAALKVAYPDRVHFLLSNHELAECQKFQIEKAGISQNLLFGTGLEYAYGPASQRIFECYCEFILSCPLGVRLANRVLICHSLPERKALATFDPRVFQRELTNVDLSPGGSAYAVVWGRDYEPDHVASLAQLLGVDLFVNGHEPSAAGFRLANDHQITLDASGPECWCCLLPLNRPVTAAEVAQSLRSLKPKSAAR